MKTLVMAFIEMMPLSLAEYSYSDQRKYSARWRERKKTSKQRGDILPLCLLWHVLTNFQHGAFTDSILCLNFMHHSRNVPHQRNDWLYH